LIAAAVSAGEAPQTMVARAAALASGEPAVPGVVPDWGTLGVSAYSVAALSFVALESTVDYTYALDSSGYRRYGTSGAATFDNTLHLASGVQILGIELDGCDASATGELQFALFAQPAGSSAAFAIAFLQTGVAETPGCSTYVAAAAPVTTVQNGLYSYGLEVYTSARAETTAFKSVRVAYRLQVAPAPASATFGDVAPTDFGFQHIEALAASGITVGCGGGNYCPSDAVTRAQMAVFLAKALGLHWAP
jgi:hypothetical protein